MSLILVRHTEVDEGLAGRCYGASDVALSAAGLARIPALAEELAARAPGHIVHSGLTRARLLAEAVAGLCALSPVADPRIAEICFGTWELRSWSDIFAEFGHDMGRVLSEPATYAPPGGETAHAVRDRVRDWYLGLPERGPIIAVCHGGPIGTLRGLHARLPVESWPRLVPAYGEVIELPLGEPI